MVYLNLVINGRAWRFKCPGWGRDDLAQKGREFANANGYTYVGVEVR